MKKIFTLLTLALLSMVSVHAEEALFDFQNNNGNWPVGEGVNYADGDLNNPISQGEVTLTAIQGEANFTCRIMKNASRGIFLQVFKGNSIKLAAAEGRAITKVEVTMQAGNFDLEPGNGTLTDGVWTGNATEVTFGPAVGARYLWAISVTTAEKNADTVEPVAETFDVEAATIADFNAVEDGKVVKLALSDARVNAYFDIPGSYYVEDATGATVIRSIQLTPGTKLNGYIIGTKKTDTEIDYVNEPAAAVEYQLIANGSADTFTAETVQLKGTALTIAQATTQANYGRLVTLKNLTISGSGQNKTLTDAEGNTIKGRDYLGVLPAGYTWPETAASITGVVIYYMTGWFIMPISAEAIQETEADAPVLFDFTNSQLRGYAGTALTDVEGYIYNETFTVGGVSLQVTAGSAPSRLTYASNRDTCLVMYKEYATLLFTAPAGKAIKQIEYVFAGTGTLNFSATPEGLDGLVWTGNATAVRFLNEGTAYLKSATVTLGDADESTVTPEALPYVAVENIAAFNALQAGTPVKLALTDAEVIAISADGYSTLFIQDATGGTYLQYTSLNTTLQPMTKLNGHLYGIKRVTSGKNELREALETPQSEMQATELDELTVTEGTIAELNVAENLGRVVKISGATLTIGKTTATAQNGTLTQGEATIDVNNGGETANQQLHKLDFTQYTEGQVISDVTIVAILSAASATKNQLLPLSITSETVDGISTATATASTAVYNLQGQRMQQLQKGINIVGGKKIMVK